MRSNQNPDEFLLTVAKKKPALQALVDNVHGMTAEQIAQLSQPQWVKQALLILQRSNGTTQKQRIAAIVDRVIAAEKAWAAMPKPTYEVRIWDGPTQFLGSGMVQHSWRIEINAGDSFLIVDDEFVRFNDSMLRICQADRTPLLQNSKLVGYMTLMNYKGFSRELVNRKHRL